MTNPVFFKLYPYDMLEFVGHHRSTIVALHWLLNLSDTKHSGARPSNGYFNRNCSSIGVP